MGKKLVLLPVLLAFVPHCGGYGALHNQVSYTVSPTTFTLSSSTNLPFPPPCKTAGSVDCRLARLVVDGPDHRYSVFAGRAGDPDWKTYVTRSLLAFFDRRATALTLDSSLVWRARRSLDDLAAGYQLPRKARRSRRFRPWRGPCTISSYFGGFFGILTASAYILFGDFVSHDSTPIIGFLPITFGVRAWFDRRRPIRRRIDLLVAAQWIHHSTARQAVSLHLQDAWLRAFTVLSCRFPAEWQFVSQSRRSLRCHSFSSFTALRSWVSCRVLSMRFLAMRSGLFLASFLLVT